MFVYFMPGGEAGHEDDPLLVQLAPRVNPKMTSSEYIYNIHSCNYTSIQHVVQVRHFVLVCQLHPGVSSSKWTMIFLRYYNRRTAV